MVHNAKTFLVFLSLLETNVITNPWTWVNYIKNTCGSRRFDQRHFHGERQGESKRSKWNCPSTWSGSQRHPCCPSYPKDLWRLSWLWVRGVEGKGEVEGKEGKEENILITSWRRVRRDLRIKTHKNTPTRIWCSTNTYVVSYTSQSMFVTHITLGTTI